MQIGSLNVNRIKNRIEMKVNLSKWIIVLVLGTMGLPVFADGEGDGGLTWSMQDTCAKEAADQQKLLEEYSTYREFYKQENYKDALPHLRYVLKHAPGFRTTPFIDGISIYETLAEKEADSLKRESYIDSVFMLYDKRIECHGERGFVLGRKAYAMYKLRPKDYDLVYNTIKESFELQGNQSEYFLIPAYMSYAVVQWKRKIIDDDKLMATYDQLIGIIDYNVSNNTDEGSYYESMRTPLDQLLPSDLLTCESLLQRVRERWDQEKDDTAKVEKLYYTLRMAKDSSGNNCLGSEEYIKVVKRLYELKPSSELAEQIGVLLFNEGKEDEAIAIFNQAVELETDPEKKGELCLNVAKILRTQKKFSNARTYAYKALDYKPNWGAPYILIGDLYASSGPLCGPGTGFDSQVVVWVAIDKYYRAKSVDPSLADEANEKIGKYSAYMPTKTDLFERGIDEGSSYTVGCWINESTTARGRKSN
jgi:tetratricopeptide (TPR) repeat protein